MGLSWDEVDGIMQRAVQRGLERREVQAPQRIGVDETSFQKRHEYVTVVNDLDGHVLHVADGRGKESLEEFYKQFDDKQLARIQTVGHGHVGAVHPREHSVRAAGAGQDRVR